MWGQGNTFNIGAIHFACLVYTTPNIQNEQTKYRAKSTGVDKTQLWLVLVHSTWLLAW